MFYISILVSAVITSIVWIIIDVIKYKKTIYGRMEIGKEDLGTETPIYKVEMGKLANISSKKYVVLDIIKVDAPISEDAEEI